MFKLVASPVSYSSSSCNFHSMAKPPLHLPSLEPVCQVNNFLPSSAKLIVHLLACSVHWLLSLAHLPASLKLSFDRHHKHRVRVTNEALWYKVPTINRIHWNVSTVLSLDCHTFPSGPRRNTANIGAVPSGLGRNDARGFFQLVCLLLEPIESEQSVVFTNVGFLTLLSTKPVSSHVSHGTQKGWQDETSHLRASRTRRQRPQVLEEHVIICATSRVNIIYKYLQQQKRKNTYSIIFQEIYNLEKKHVWSKEGKALRLPVFSSFLSFFLLSNMSKTCQRKTCQSGLALQK